MKGGQEQGQQQEQQRGMHVLCNCICAWQPVRVVHGDGHIRRLTPPVTVAELLKWHPHHFVCEPTSTGPMYHSGMLPVDMELEEGRIYLLLPLPRLLPHLASNFPNPPSCPCFSHHRDDDNNNNLQYSSSSDGAQNDVEQQQQGKADMEQVHEFAKVDNFQAGGQFLVVAKSMRKLRHRAAKSKLVRSLLRRILWLFRFRHRRADNQSDDHDAASINNAKAGHYSCSRNRWTPGLECISEVDLLTGLLNRDSQLTGDW